MRSPPAASAPYPFLPASALAMPRRHASPKPLYAQVRDLLLARVRGGEWGAGETLPNEHVLSGEFNVSVGTVRRAVAELEANGVLVRRQGRGTYVSGQGAAALQERFCALRTPEGQRLAADYELVSLAGRTATPGELARLPAASAQGVVEVVQRLVAADRPVGIEISVLPAGLLPRLDTQLRFGQHLYPVLADYGLLVTRVEDTIGVEPADTDLLAGLGVVPDQATGAARGTPVQAMLAVSRLALALDGQPVELRSGRYLPSLVRYAGAAAAPLAG